MSLVMAFALKNLAIVHQQYFNDPTGGYHKGHDYYGDQFATCFIRHLKGNASRYHINPEKICCFGHSKGSEIPGMLLNKLRAEAPYAHSKADFRKVSASEQEKTLRSAYPHLSTEIAGAILGAGIANSELASDKLNPWDRDPSKNISPFFLYSDHRTDTRLATRNTIAKARAHGLPAETAEMDAHTWPSGLEYDRASAFADRILQPEY
jgi:acetyl esterase/lipase